MKKNRKRIVAAFMTVLMALTLVPTWLLGGVFATTAKADDAVYTATSGTIGDYFKLQNKVVDDAGNSAKVYLLDGKEVKSKGRIKLGTVESSKDTGSITFTVAEGKKAKVEVWAISANSTTDSEIGIFTSSGDVKAKAISYATKNKKLGDIEYGKAKNGIELTVSADELTAGDYYIATVKGAAQPSNVYYVRVTETSAGPVVGDKPSVQADSVKAVYNSETGKIDVTWEAAVEGSGSSVFNIYVNDSKNPVKSVPCTEYSYSYEPTASGEYTFTVKGALGTDEEETGATGKTTCTLPLSAPTVKATRVPTDGTKINVEASGSEAEKYEFSVYDSDKKLVKTVEAEAKDGKAATTVEGLKEGYKYYVSATAVRGEEKKESDGEKMASVMPYAEKDTSQAIPGMTVINTNDADNSKTVSLTIVRENGTIKAGQTSGKSSKIEKTGIKYGSLIAAPATTKDFTFSATIKVTGAERGTSTSKQQGVYLGAFADTKQATKDIISAELGTDGKAYSAYIGIKKDGEFDRDGGVDAKLDTEYKVTITRTGSVYTYSVKNKNDDVVMQESVTATADALKEGGAAIPAIALVGATATITNIKLTVDGKAEVDAANFTGSFNPFVDNWAIVDAPVLSDVTTEENKKDGKITIKVDEEISPVGAAEVSVDMIDAEGKVVDTKVASSTGASVTFEPKASGDYSFKAYATRPTETTKKESESITV